MKILGLHIHQKWDFEERRLKLKEFLLSGRNVGLRSLRIRRVILSKMANYNHPSKHPHIQKIQKGVCPSCNKGQTLQDITGTRRAERVRLYPSTEIADYLLYVCSYCLDKFYLIHPDRGEGLNPFRGGFILESKDNRRLRPICHRCVLDLLARRRF